MSLNISKMQHNYRDFIPRPSSPLTYPPLSCDSPAHVPVPFSLDLIHDFHQHFPYPGEQEWGTERHRRSSLTGPFPTLSARPLSPFLHHQPIASTSRISKDEGEAEELDHDGLNRRLFGFGSRISARERKLALEEIDVEFVDLDDESLEEEFQPEPPRRPLRRPESPVPAILDQDSDETHESTGSTEGGSTKATFLCFGRSGLKRRRSNRKRARQMKATGRSTVWGRWRNRIFRRRDSNLPPALQEMVQKPVTPEEYHEYFLNLYMRGPSGSE